MTSTGSTSKGVLQYSQNMVQTVFSTICALVKSVAVISINTSFVSRLICSNQTRLRRYDLVIMHAMITQTHGH